MEVLVVVEVLVAAVAIKYQYHLKVCSHFNDSIVEKEFISESFVDFVLDLEDLLYFLTGDPNGQ